MTGRSAPESTAPDNVRSRLRRPGRVVFFVAALLVALGLGTSSASAAEVGGCWSCEGSTGTQLTPRNVLLVADCSYGRLTVKPWASVEYGHDWSGQNVSYQYRISSYVNGYWTAWSNSGWAGAKWIAGKISVNRDGYYYPQGYTYPLQALNAAYYSTSLHRYWQVQVRWGWQNRNTGAWSYSNFYTPAYYTSGNAGAYSTCRT